MLKSGNLRRWWFRDFDAELMTGQGLNEVDVNVRGPKSEAVMMGHHPESGVVRSGAISNGSGASLEHLVCISSMDSWLSCKGC